VPSFTECLTFPPKLRMEKYFYSHALLTPCVSTRLDTTDLHLCLAHRRSGQACSRGGAVRQLELC